METEQRLIERLYFEQIRKFTQRNLQLAPQRQAASPDRLTFARPRLARR